MIKKWTKYVFIYIGYVVIAIMLAIVIKGKLSYKSLFSQEFCDSIEKIYFYDFNEDVYEITDKDVIAEVGKILYENGYKKLKKKDYVEGAYTFVFISEGKEYNIGMSADHIGWQGNQYKVKEPLNDMLDKLLPFL